MPALDIVDDTIEAVASGSLTYVCALPSEGHAVGFVCRLYAEYTMGKNSATFLPSGLGSRIMQPL
jgi:hypothetical protein